MEEQIPKEFMCPNCKADIRILGLWERVGANYIYDHDHKKFVIEEVERNCEESLFCQNCFEEFNYDFEDGLSEEGISINSNVKFKRKITRYGNIMIEEEYKL